MSLYDLMTELHGSLPWGSVLDAGTGPASLRWLLRQPTDRWTAVTGATPMGEKVRAVAGAQMRAVDRLVVGNWLDPTLLEGETFDTVVADYLVGAIEGFAPYWKDQIFARLRPLVGSRLYVVGLEPYVPYTPDDEHGRLVVRIGRVRDACLLLANDRPYREYPLDWCLRQLERSGYRTVDVRKLAIRCGNRFITSQLDLCAAATDRWKDRSLAVAMHAHIAALRAEALAVARRDGALRHGHDYVIVAEPRSGER